MPATSVGFQGLSGGAGAGTHYPLALAEGTFATAPSGGTRSGSAQESLDSVSACADGWMLPGVPTTDGIQLPELPPAFDHAPDYPMLTEDDTVLFDALYGS